MTNFHNTLYVTSEGAYVARARERFGISAGRQAQRRLRLEMARETNFGRLVEHYQPSAV